ncbi:uncharacterized protein EAE97_011113 [Botrytis byssoidea]|uniref:Uncharacterized protein n=1 Tax=Botrytis byssoidea TaxID=139641 RepID=A0A9P5HTA4_9HELO|nr:uncharacterized protein EAE97_011113 [Botrytis byssoidea]KAF7922371.1 hypothetical protein EAE97_011113 [Botrytis byssoidea]
MHCLIVSSSSSTMLVAGCWLLIVGREISYHVKATVESDKVNLNGSTCTFQHAGLITLTCHDNKIGLNA